MCRELSYLRSVLIEFSAKNENFTQKNENRTKKFGFFEISIISHLIKSKFHWLKSVNEFYSSNIFVQV